MKKIILLFILITCFSCFNANIDINFLNSEQGEYKLILEFDKNTTDKDTVDKMLEKEYNLAINELKTKNIDLKFNYIGEKKSKYSYEFKANFDNFETLDKLYSLSQNVNFFIKDNLETKRYIIKNSENEVEINLGKTNIPVKIRIKDGKIKGTNKNEIEFKEGQLVNFKYRKNNFKWLYITFIIILLTLIILPIVIYLIFKIIKKIKNKNI